MLTSQMGIVTPDECVHMAMVFLRSKIAIVAKVWSASVINAKLLADHG